MTRERRESHDQKMAEFILPWLRQKFGAEFIEVMNRRKGSFTEAQRVPSLLIHDRDGSSASVLVRGAMGKHTTFYFEFWESTEPNENPGWMRYAEFQWLVYYFTLEGDRLEVFFIDLKKLRDWYWKPEIYDSRYRPRPMNWKNPGSSVGSKIPINTVSKEVGNMRRAVIARGGEEIEKMSEHFAPGQRQQSLFGGAEA